MPSELLPYAFFGGVLLLFALLVRVAMTLTRRAREQHEELERRAAEWGYHPAPEAQAEVAAALAESLRFQHGSVAVDAVLRRAVRPARFLVEYRFGGGSGSSSSRGLLFLLDRRQRPLPRFMLQTLPAGAGIPRLLAAGLERLVRLRWPDMRQVDLDRHAPQLEPAMLYSPEPEATAHLIDGAVVDALARHRGWGLESTASWLLAEQHRRGGSGVPKADAAIAALQAFEELARVLERS